MTAYMAKEMGIAIGPRHVGNYLKACSWRPRRPVRTDKHKQHDVAAQVSLVPTIVRWMMRDGIPVELVEHLPCRWLGDAFDSASICRENATTQGMSAQQIG
ncbi:MAG: hypothetical protein WBB22_15055 [Anaerolineae bacterium]